MDMQDKEFDELFRAKLDGFETEPSASVWAGIAGGLDSAKRSGNPAYWLRIAASIVVLIGAALFIIPKKTATGAHIPVKPQIAKTLPPEIKTQAPSAPAIQASPGKNYPVKSRQTAEFARVRHNKPSALTPLKNADTARSMPKEIKRNEPQLMAYISQPTIIKTPVVPDPTIPLAVKTGIDQSTGPGLRPDKLASQDPTGNKRDSVLVKRRHKIHNFGDLVNLVVDKLDKRPEKVVQFADDADGDSHLTGVNLGIVKIKKGE